MAKKRRYKKRKKTTSKLDMTVISLIVCSILLAVLIYTKSGVVGLKLNEILRRYNGSNAICASYWCFCACNKTRDDYSSPTFLHKIIQNTIITNLHQTRRAGACLPPKTNSFRQKNKQPSS